jgi:uncharacterized paraquat-inducible protein A
MTPSSFASRRCRNHIERQAACRCPGCGFDFCRECVTEHDERLLCSRCMAELGASGTRPSRSKTIGTIAQAVAGIAAAWIFFFLAGELTSMVVSPSHEVRAWHAR